MSAASRSPVGPGGSGGSGGSVRRRIVVTDGEQRAALATVRSLGAAGHELHVVASRRGSIAGSSRFAHREHVLPHALREPQAFVTALTDLTARVGADVLLPVSEPALLAVLPERARFSSVIPFAAEADFREICDKALVCARAEAVGLCIPTQVVARDAAEGRQVAGSLRYPVVVKPVRSVAGPADNRTKTAVSYALESRALVERLGALPASAFPVLLQERIDGPGIAVSLLLWDGAIRAAFGHRRLREKPPSGGVSTLRESIPLAPDLLARSVALLQRFHWDGVAMVEYKVDRRSGTPYLMEINGRLWGSLQLAIDAGVDFPRLLLGAALGEAPAAIPSYPSGVRTRWEWGDVDHLVARLLHDSDHLALPDDAPGRWRTTVAVLRGLAGAERPEVFRRDDPRPFLRETMDWLRRR